MGNYSGTKSAAYIISPAALRVETDDASKPYDGTPLTASGGAIHGLVNDETATLVTTGSITKVGSAPNGYEIRWDGTAK